jgi:hypothetical protein
MPKGKKIERKDDPDTVDMYKRGGKVKKYKEGGESSGEETLPDKETPPAKKSTSDKEVDSDIKFDARPLGGMMTKQQKALIGQLSATKQLDKDSSIRAYLNGALSKREGSSPQANLSGIGVEYRRTFAKGGGVNAAGNYTKPTLRKKIVSQVKAAATQGTGAGQWSARKAQLVAKKYKAAGGGYRD